MNQDQTTTDEARQGWPRPGDRVRATSFANPDVQLEGAFLAHHSDFVSHLECDGRDRPCPVLRATIRPQTEDPK